MFRDPFVSIGMVVLVADGSRLCRVGLGGIGGIFVLVFGVCLRVAISGEEGAVVLGRVFVIGWGRRGLMLIF